VNPSILFLHRRGELAPEHTVPVELTQLKSGVQVKFEITLFINYALCRVNGTNEGWKHADDLVLWISHKIKEEPLDSDDLDWWKWMHSNGDAEGTLVLIWLQRHGIVSEYGHFQLPNQYLQFGQPPSWLKQPFNGRRSLQARRAEPTQEEKAAKAKKRKQQKKNRRKNRGRR
jgi:hypothetical protein